MKHIFISYARKNRKKVDELVARLQVDGFEMRRQEIDGVQKWCEEIIDAIDNAYAFLIALSPASVVSNDLLEKSEFSGRLVTEEDPLAASAG